jgi:hypothetical protein
MVAQGIQGGDGHPPRRAGARLDELCEHQLRQVRDVLGELAQRRNAERELGQSRPQFGVELVLLGEAARIGRREAHHAHLVLLGARQQELEIALLPASKPRQVRQEQDSARRLGQQIRRRLAEELGAGQERRRRRREQAREKLRPHAALAAQRERRGRLRQLRQPLLRLGKRGRASERRERERRRGRGLRAAQRALHGREQSLQRDRLLEEVERADPGRLDGGLDGGMAGHHHDRHGELAARGPFLQKRDAVGVRHPDVEQHQVRTSALAQATRFAGAFGKQHLVPLVGEDLGEQLADSDLVVDDQDLRHRYAALARGSRTLTDAPRLGRFSIATLPWCSSMIFFTIARPRPVPRGLVVT